MKPADRAHLHVAARSHPGMSGKNNEDRYAVSAYYLDASPPLPSLLAVVADGIGGHRAGEIAAEIAVETISKTVADSDGSQPVKTLEEALIHASQAIFEQSQKDQNRKGMGSTCACTWVIDDRLYTACVGDSRIYLLRGETIQQISTDHTWVQEAIDHGALSPDQARNHPNAHVIRRYLGSRQQVVPDLRLRLSAAESDAQAQANQGLRLEPGDQLLLCSDGLTDLVNPEEIAAALAARSQEEALDELVDLANQRGGHDNITTLALQVPLVSAQALEAPPVIGRRRLQLACLGSGALLLAATLLVGVILFWRGILPTGSRQTSAPLTFTPPAASATLPAQFTPALAETPNLPESPSPSPLAPSSPSPSPVQATLTPWPTNTASPE